LRNSTFDGKEISILWVSVMDARELSEHEPAGQPNALYGAGKGNGISVPVSTERRDQVLDRTENSSLLLLIRSGFIPVSGFGPGAAG
jgi:hypothetical protein